MPSLLSHDPAISCFDDLDFFNDFENKFAAIVYNDAQTSKSDLLIKLIYNPQHIDEFDLNNETSLSEYKEEEQNVLGQDMALPPREQRHPFLRYEGLQYSDTDTVDFESRLARIYQREVHKIILAFRLHTDEEMQTSGFGTYWADSARLCHRLIACSIAGRSQALEKVTLTGLFYLRGMDVDSVNVTYLLARYLRLFAAGMKSEDHISGGQFVARLAKHFRLLTAEILRGLTVAMGPERQPDAAAGAPGVAQDAPVIDEGRQDDLTPVQAPPPPPAATRTMPQRMAILKEDVHEIHGTLAEQREVISAMAHDFSRFCTWITTSLARMMDRAGVTYTSYSETPREYTRCVRSRTEGASTSAALQDQQQPDP
ncbi:hypothetical protein Tco_0104044 [Tanacetum coccineum]